MAPWRSCELSNVIGTFVSFILGVVALVLYCVSVGAIDRALLASGSGAGLLRTVVHLQDEVLAFILLLNIVATISVGLSTFHINTCQNVVTHAVTSSKALCVMRVLAALSFLAQLVQTQYFVVALASLSQMSYICELGHPVIYQTQQLVYSIGNWTVAGGVAGYDPWGPPKAYNAADTPFVSMKSFLHGLDMDRYCASSSADLRRKIILFWLSCFITVISQALITATVNGEKERVYMHELHDEVNDVLSPMSAAGGFIREVRSQAQDKGAQLGQFGSSLYSQVSDGSMSNRTLGPLLGGATYH